MVFWDLVQLNHQGFIKWETSVLKLAGDLDLDITDIAIDCKTVIWNRLISSCITNLHNIQLSPILRTYMCFKSDFVIEPYLHLVKERQYREAILKFRCSSHTMRLKMLDTPSPEHWFPLENVFYAVPLKMKCTFCWFIWQRKIFIR